MALNNKNTKANQRGANEGRRPGLGRARLARHLFRGRVRPGQSVRSDKIATGEDFSAVVNLSDPKEMLDAYNLRAAIEEIGGRAAATALEGNVAALREELGGMPAALHDGNLDACAEHEINFHRSILRASQNDTLLRVWDSLALDVRMRR